MLARINATLTLVKALVKEGHDVTYYTTKQFCDNVKSNTGANVKVIRTCVNTNQEYSYSINFIFKKYLLLFNNIRSLCWCLILLLNY